MNQMAAPAGAAPACSIRAASPDDLPVLHSIDQACFPADTAFTRAGLRFYLRQSGAVARVAEIEDRIAGFAIGHIENRLAAHVITIDVRAEFRKRGVGRALMGALHSEFDAQAIPMVFLEVDTTNEVAHRFYEGLGYRRIETLRGYYNRGRDAYRMVRVLEPR